MSVFIIVFICLTSITILLSIIFGISYYFRDKNVSKKNHVEKLDWFSRGLIAIAILVLLFSFFSPLLFTHKVYNDVFDFKDTGTIGDTIGGIMNPFISLAGVIITGLAFYMQYRANKIQRELFHKEQEITIEQFNQQLENQVKESDLQKFESKFYEMLRIQRENVSEWIYISSNSESKYSINGRIISVEIFKQFCKLYDEIQEFSNRNNIKPEKYYTTNYLKKLKLLFKRKDITEVALIEISYIILFYGLSQSSLENIYIEKDKFDENELQFLILYLIQKPAKYYPKHWKRWISNKSKSKFNQLTDDYVKYYGGHEHRLGHYFRHLYNMVRLVDKQEYLTYIEKWEYVGLIRSQLSNKEQFLLFINSISYLGRGWDYEPISTEKESSFDVSQLRYITKYDLIKHIPEGLREKYHIKDYYPDVEFDNKKGLTEDRKKLEKNYK